MATSTIYETRIFNGSGLFFTKIYSTVKAARAEAARVFSMIPTEDKKVWSGYVTRLQLNDDGRFMPDTVLYQYEF